MAKQPLPAAPASSSSTAVGAQPSEPEKEGEVSRLLVVQEPDDSERGAQVLLGRELYSIKNAAAFVEAVVEGVKHLEQPKRRLSDLRRAQAVRSAVAPSPSAVVAPSAVDEATPPERPSASQERLQALSRAFRLAKDVVPPPRAPAPDAPEEVERPRAEAEEASPESVTNTESVAEFQCGQDVYKVKDIAAVQALFQKSGRGPLAKMSTQEVGAAAGADVERQPAEATNKKRGPREPKRKLWDLIRAQRAAAQAEEAQAARGSQEQAPTAPVADTQAEALSPTVPEREALHRAWRLAKKDP